MSKNRWDGRKYNDRNYDKTIVYESSNNFAIFTLVLSQFYLCPIGCVHVFSPKEEWVAPK